MRVSSPGGGGGATAVRVLSPGGGGGATAARVSSPGGKGGGQWHRMRLSSAFPWSGLLFAIGSEIPQLQPQCPQSL